MGLSIARTIIDAHSGRITVHNQAGTGALFRVTLPLGRAGLLSKGAAGASDRGEAGLIAVRGNVDPAV
jgi:hypothetical protein